MRGREEDGAGGIPTYPNKHTCSADICSLLHTCHTHHACLNIYACLYTITKAGLLYMEREANSFLKAPRGRLREGEAREEEIP